MKGPRAEQTEAAGIQSASRSAHVDADQIAERLSWTPKQRLAYLLDMLDFEERAARARRVS